MHETVFKLGCTFHYVIDENTNWGHYVICDITLHAHYIFWYLVKHLLGSNPVRTKSDPHQQAIQKNTLV